MGPKMVTFPNNPLLTISSGRSLIPLKFRSSCEYLIHYQSEILVFIHYVYYVNIHLQTF